MQEIEAHFYGRGHAYRYGGDEYTFILPNATKETSVSVLDALRKRISQLNYEVIKEKTTVSIGLCHVDPECPLTEREILGKATEAKEHAKEEGKNRIAAYKDGNRFRKEDLEIVDME